MRKYNNETNLHNLENSVKLTRKDVFNTLQTWNKYLLSLPDYGRHSDQIWKIIPCSINSF